MVTTVEEISDITVAVFTLTEDMPAFIKTALSPNPKAAISESNIPVINLRFIPQIINHGSEYQFAVCSSQQGITATFRVRHHT